VNAAGPDHDEEARILAAQDVPASGSNRVTCRLLVSGTSGFIEDIATPRPWSHQKHKDARQWMVAPERPDA
jgi:hypothetical protein